MNDKYEIERIRRTAFNSHKHRHISSKIYRDDVDILIRAYENVKGELKFAYLLAAALFFMSIFGSILFHS